MSTFGFLEYAETGQYGIQLDNDYLYCETFMSRKGRVYKFSINGEKFQAVSKPEMEKVYNKFIERIYKKIPCDEKIRFFDSLEDFVFQ